MFTIKFRTYEIELPKDAGDLIGCYENERIDGPYDTVSQKYENGRLIVTGYYDSSHPGMTYGAVEYDDPPNYNRPRPMLWVMNEAGATVAKYTL